MALIVPMEVYLLGTSKVYVLLTSMVRLNLIQYPAAKLVKNEYSHGNTVVVVPEEVEGRWTMMGGNLARSSDSRFSRAIEELLEVKTFYGGIPIHDRVEEYR